MGANTLLQGFAIGPNFTENGNNIFALTGATTPGVAAAFRFMPQGNCNITALKLYIATVTSSPTDVRISLYTDNLGNVGTLINGSETIGVGVTASAINTFNFKSNQAVAANTAYWAVIKNYSVDTSFQIISPSFAGTSYQMNRSATSATADSWAYGYTRVAGLSFSDGYSIDPLQFNEMYGYVGLSSDSHYFRTSFRSPYLPLEVEALYISIGPSTLNSGTSWVVDMRVAGKTYTTIPLLKDIYGGTTQGVIMPFFSPVM